MKSKKIKVLFTVPNFKTAGSQYVVLSLFHLIDRLNFEAFVAVESFPEIKPDIIPDDKLLYLPKKGDLKKDIKRMIRQLKMYNIDIVHSWDYKSSPIEAIATRLAGIKYLYTKKNDAWSKRWFFKSIISSHIAYDNPVMNEKFFNNFLLNYKTTFIPHGVDENLFRNYNFKNSSNNINLGCVGNINKNKNQLLLINGIKSLSENVHLYFFGRADEVYLKELQEYISENNLEKRIHFKGFVPNIELPLVLNKLDIFLLASQNEGLPVSILEALSCGIPVLASDSGGGTKYISQKGEGVIVFENNNLDDFLNKLVPLIEIQELREKLGKEGRSLIENQFSVNKELRSYENLYYKLLN